MSKTVISTLDGTKTHGFESVAEDRPYTSLLFTQLHESIGFGGASSSFGDQLDPVVTGNDKNVTISTGAGFIVGHFFVFDTPKVIPINDAPAGQIRWDLIAIRIDRSSNVRNFQLIKVEGIPTTSDDTNSIPYNLLTNDELGLNAGIFEYPIAAVKMNSNNNIGSAQIIKTFPSTNVLEPMPTVEQTTLGTSAQTSFRVFVPNSKPLNSNSETTLKIKIPVTNSTLEATIVFNNFNGSESVIPLMNQFNNQPIKANQIKNMEIEVEVATDKSKAIIKKFMDSPIFSESIIDRTDFNFTNKTEAEIFAEFGSYSKGTKIKIKMPNLTSSNIDNRQSFNPPVSEESYDQSDLNSYFAKMIITSSNSNDREAMIIIENYYYNNRTNARINILKIIFSSTTDPTNKKIFQGFFHTQYNQSLLDKNSADQLYKPIDS